jgi:hypothetical protein
MRADIESRHAWFHAVGDRPGMIAFVCSEPATLVAGSDDPFQASVRSGEHPHHGRWRNQLERKTDQPSKWLVRIQHALDPLRFL